MSTSEDVLVVLRSIDASLKALVSQRPASSAPPSEPIQVDLDGPHGDPIIKAKDPRDWSGPSMLGKRFSECPAAYLDLLADRYRYFAGRESDPKKARYNSLDAARAAGWADRVRHGYTPPTSTPSPTPWGDF